MNLKGIISTVACALVAQFTFSQTISVTNTQTPEDLILNVLAGGGVTISNITYNGSGPNAQVVQPTVGYFNENGSGFGLDEGVIISTGNVTDAANPATFFASTGLGGPSDPDMTTMAGSGTFDAVILEFDFIPVGDSVSFNFVFASEEYPNYAPPNGTFNDVFGFFLSGPGINGPWTNNAENIAILPGGQEISIDNINAVTNTQYYIDNGSGTSVPYGGMSTVLTTILPTSLQCGQTYHFKIALADAIDAIFDTAIFLEANSFTSQGADLDIELIDQLGNPLIGNQLVEGCTGAQITFVGPPGYTDSTVVVNVATSGTATNGSDYTTLNPTYTIPPGQDSITITIEALQDGMGEPTETLIIDTYYISACGDTISVIDTIYIADAAPTFDVLTTDITIDCPQALIDVTATTNGGIPQLTYDWGVYGTGQTVQVPGNIGGTTTYNVTVTDACGVVENGSIDVTLNAGPPPTINFNQNTFTICPGEVANIDATVNNPYDPGQVTYLWQPTGETTEDISATPVVLTWYYLNVFDGCYDIIDSVKVDIGTVDITSINVVNATNCPGLVGAPGEIHVQPDNPLWTYTLIGGGQTFGPQNDGDFTGLNGGVTYFLNVLSDDGCTIDTAVAVGLGTNPVLADFVLDSLRDITCFGDGNGGAYINNISGGVSNPYTVSWTHTSGLHAQFNNVPVGGSSDVDDLFGGQWVVTVTDPQGCAWSQVFDLFEPDEMVIDFTFNDPNCYLFNDGSVTVNITGGNGGDTFTISDSVGTQVNSPGSNTANQLTAGWYYAQVVDSEGCSVQDSVEIDDPGELLVDLNITQPLCYGLPSGVAEVTNVYNYNGDIDSVAYFWNPNPSAIPNGQNAEVINHLPEGQYTLTVNDENGCSNTFDFEIIYPSPVVVNLSTEPAYCRVYDYQVGNGVVIVSASGGAGIQSYEWTELNTGLTSNNTTWGGRNPGPYAIEVIDNNGCTFNDTIMLDSLNPEASFDVISQQFLTPEVYEGTAEVCIEFPNTSQYYANPNNPLADTTFYWNMNYDPGNPGAGWQILHDTTGLDTCYTSAGDYEVCLVAINKNGCTDTMCHTMIIYDPLTFVPVNVFTPNNDGDNDFFTFAYYAQAVATFECVIVNRWGQTVHIMNDINDSWDGTNMAGNPCPDGIYFYTYTGTATDGTPFSGQGNVWILASP